jgi:hypothetical protein
MEPFMQSESTRKTCTRCKEIKNTSDFHRSSRRADGLNPWCKTCAISNARSWYQQNKNQRGKPIDPQDEKPLLVACATCKTELPATTKFFWKSTVGKHGIQASCKKCTMAVRKAFNAKHREEIGQKRSEYYRKRRIDVMRHYCNGHDPSCVCCGESRYEFLSFDHVNGGGTKHVKQIRQTAIWKWIESNGYPLGFQILCHNCNMAKGIYGKCPHQAERKSASNIVKD